LEAHPRGSWLGLRQFAVAQVVYWEKYLMIGVILVTKWSTMR